MGINRSFIKKLKDIKVFSISDFLSTYGITNNITNEITHATLKQLFNYLQTYPNSMVEQDLSILYKGDGVLVIDSSNEILCYKAYLLKKREVENSCIENLIITPTATKTTKYKLKKQRPKHSKQPKQPKKQVRIRELNFKELSKDY